MRGSARRYCVARSRLDENNPAVDLTSTMGSMVFCAFAAAASGVATPVMALVHREGQGVGDLGPAGMRAAGLRGGHLRGEHLHDGIIGELRGGHVLARRDIAEVVDVGLHLGRVRDELEEGDGLVHLVALDDAEVLAAEVGGRLRADGELDDVPLQVGRLLAHGRDLPGPVDHHGKVPRDELVHDVALGPVDDFLGHRSALHEVTDQRECPDAVGVVDLEGCVAAAPEEAQETEGAFLVLDRADAEAVDVALGRLEGDALELVPGLRGLDPGGLQHVLVVVEREAVAPEGDAVEPAVQLAGIERSLEVLLEVGPRGQLVGDVGEDAHCGVGRVVRIIDNHDIRQLRGSGAYGKLLLEVREGDVLRHDLDRVLRRVEVLADPGEGLLMLRRFPVIPDRYRLLRLGEGAAREHREHRDDHESRYEESLHAEPPCIRAVAAMSPCAGKAW